MNAHTIIKPARPGLLTPSAAYKPFRIPLGLRHLEEASSRFTGCPRRCRWARTCKRLGAVKLTDTERNLLTQIFRFFTQADVEVSGLLPRAIRPRLQAHRGQDDAFAAFANMETVHIAAYSHLLLDTIGMPESEYSAPSSNTRK
jgi:ribonucleoside-diphosphate reductase beta chain